MRKLEAGILCNIGYLAVTGVGTCAVKSKKEEKKKLARLQGRLGKHRMALGK